MAILAFSQSPSQCQQDVENDADLEVNHGHLLDLKTTCTNDGLAKLRLKGVGCTKPFTLSDT
jgi:hypothetical protein